VDVLNARFAVLQEMLDMLRDHQNNKHSARLEMIVIWLILVEVGLGCFGLLCFEWWCVHGRGGEGADGGPLGVCVVKVAAA